jgi:Mn-containing catalase
MAGYYVNSNGDLTVDLRSNIAAESRAKIVYEYLLQFTDDPYVQESLRFLMTREISHFQMFAAALEDITPNFPPGVLQGDPRFTHTYFNMSNGASARGPWNQGKGPWPGSEEWVYIDNPVKQVVETHGQIRSSIEGTSRSESEMKKVEEQLSRARSQEVSQNVPKSENQWSAYPQEELASPTKVER